MAPPTLPQSPDRLAPTMYPPLGAEAYEPHRAGVFGLPAVPASAGEARRTVRELLDEWEVRPETR